MALRRHKIEMPNGAIPTRTITTQTRRNSAGPCEIVNETATGEMKSIREEKPVARESQLHETSAEHPRHAKIAPLRVRRSTVNEPCRRSSESFPCSAARLKARY